MYTIYRSPACLAHHGVVGMKWGIRRYQPYPKGYSGSGKEVGIAARMGIRTKRDVKKYQKKLVKRAEQSSWASLQEQNKADKYDKKAWKTIGKAVKAYGQSQINLNQLPEKTKAKVNSYIDKRDKARGNAMTLRMRADYDIDAAKSFTDEAIKAYGDIKLKDVPTNMLDAMSKFEKRLEKSSTIGTIAAGPAGGFIAGSATMRDYNKYVNEILKDPTVYMPKEHLKVLAGEKNKTPRQTVHYVKL